MQGSSHWGLDTANAIYLGNSYSYTANKNGYLMIHLNSANGVGDWTIYLNSKLVMDFAPAASSSDWNGVSDLIPMAKGDTISITPNGGNYFTYLIFYPLK